MGRIEHDAPRAAEALGLVERYSYLRGASGKRYLFTAVPNAGDQDYPGAVVVLTAAGEGARRIVWVGETDDLGFRHGRGIGRRARRTSTLVHLLARDADSRRQVIRDLRQDIDGPVAAATRAPHSAPRDAAE